MNLFRLDASIRTEGSVSREVADTVERAWRAEHPYGSVTRRDVGAEPLRPELWIDAVAHRMGGTSTEGATLAARLVDELLAADGYVFAVPLYNFGVPTTIKTWVDLVITDARMAPGAPQPLAGRPAVLVVSRGGGYGPGTPREGWDHSTPWLRRILADVFGLDLRVVEAELTLAGVNPAMAALLDQAEQSRRAAHDAAAEHGRGIATASARQPSPVQA